MNAPKSLLFILFAYLAFSVDPLFSAAQPSGVSPEAHLLPELSIDVSGEVARPGTLQLPNGATVIDALFAAGGPTAWADLRNARVLRKNGGTININFQMMVEGRTAPRVLRRGDRLFLPKVIIGRPR